jgi:hypothetical protein
MNDCSAGARAWHPSSSMSAGFSVISVRAESFVDTVEKNIHGRAAKVRNGTGC